MLSTPHILVGGAIVKSIPNPWISLPLAFLSHFLFDIIPHWDFSPKLEPKTLAKIFIDYAIGLAALFWLSLGREELIFIVVGGILATLPDFMLAGYRLFNLGIMKIEPLESLNKFHMNIQNRVSILWGSVFSIITILISVFILVK